MNKYQGTKTQQNLKDAFAGESMARNKYTYFASCAKKAGYEQIADFFTKTAENEKEHAKIWLKELSGINELEKNLEDAIEAENYECTKMYQNMAKEALEDGFEELADKFKLVSEIEKTHKERFLKLLKNLKEDSVFKNNEEKTWECRNCGYNFKGKEALEICPFCEHPKAYFEIQEINY